jgi:hypothetical protein
VARHVGQDLQVEVISLGVAADQAPGLRVQLVDLRHHEGDELGRRLVVHRRYDVHEAHLPTLIVKACRRLAQEV